jgi:hypothetical protein
VMIRPAPARPRELPVREAPPPAKAAAVVAPAPAQPDCNPPYYFEGSKKVFKSACL